jgi:hypothetical protein
VPEAVGSRLAFRLDGVTDNSSWLSDMLSVMGGAPITEWPEPLQAAALEKLDLPADALAGDESGGSEGGGMPEEDAGGTSEVPGGADGAARTLGAGGRPISCAAVDVERIEREMDDAEARIARELMRIATQHRKSFRERYSDEVEDNRVDPKVLRSKARRMRSDYLPQYREVVSESLRDLAERGALSVYRETGLGEQPVRLPSEALTELDVAADQIAQEAYQRQQGYLEERLIDFAHGDETRALPKLAESSWRGIAQRAPGLAYNVGRDHAIKRVRARINNGATQLADQEILAERISVLDSNTCSTCRQLDGTVTRVGSQRYEDLKPPARCEGRHRCRCINSYVPEGSPDFKDLLSEVE